MDCKNCKYGHEFNPLCDACENCLGDEEDEEEDS